MYGGGRGEACVYSKRAAQPQAFSGLLEFFFSEGGLFSNRSLIPLMVYKICAEEAENARKSLFDVFLGSRVRLTAELAP